MQNNGVPAPIVGRLIQGSVEIVIVGNGIAGLTAAVEARRFAPHKKIAMVSEQCHPTINTPALKQFMLGKVAREQLLAYPFGTEKARNIQVIQARVEEIDVHERCVWLAKGRKLGYGSLLLATGSRATGLPAHVQGREFDGVLVLHRLRDYLDLRRRLREVNEVVVIGGGIHAAETVMCLLQLGKKVHWLLRGKSCLSRVLNLAGAELVLRHVQQAGARVYRETEVVEIAGSVGAVAGVVTSHGQVILCQLVLVCTGTKPVTTLAEQCSLPLIHERGRGILVDDSLGTSISGIYAAGDVAAFKNPLTGIHQAQAQWYNAVVQGLTVAAAITGQPVAGLQTSLGVPWHATRLGSLSILTVGSALLSSEKATVHTDIGKSGYRRLVIANNRLVGYLSVGSAQPEGLAIKRLIDEGHPPYDVEEALLKGTFDARRYFSKLCSPLKSTLAGVDGGGNAVVKRAGSPATFDCPRPVAGPAPTARLSHTTESLSFPQEEGMPGRRPQTEPLRKLVPVHGQKQQEQTGSAERVNRSALPHTPVSSLLVSLPSSERHVRSRNLWSYDRQDEPIP